MNRPEAADTLRRLATGLEANVYGVGRLLERISATDEPELLRDLLIERGAAALLDEEAQ